MSEIGIFTSSSLSTAGINGAQLAAQLTSGKIGQLQESTGCFSMSAEINDQLDALRNSKRLFRDLDRVTLLALAVGERAIPTEILSGEERIGVTVGSSRGPTETLERAMHSFITEGSVPVPTSPLTTYGNLATMVAQHLNLVGPRASLSATCTSGSMSLLHGYSMLASGLCDAFLAIGSEAPNTPFTKAQMSALGILATDLSLSYPCQPLASSAERSSGLLLGEGAAAVLLAKREQFPKTTLRALLSGIGCSSEPLSSLTGISDEGRPIESAMQEALHQAGDPEIDLILMHAPGTRKGDAAELRAVERCFPSAPPLYSPKWCVGHTFGASGLLSLDLALAIMEGAPLHPLPYPALGSAGLPLSSPPKHILINSAGFGGIAVSTIVSAP